jgi:phospholipid/cholesterol/gamma-HCH transport system substrate-binding protein
METRARYVLMGLFALAVIVAGFGFVYWLENTGGLGERSTYRIRFDGSVSGLLLGSGVQFNGIRVGEVTKLGLNADDPRQVIVTVTVNADTPVKADTQVGLVFNGLTGIAEVALTGGTPGAAAPQASDGGPPLLVASEGTNVDWTQAAREAFVQIDALLSNNSEGLSETVSNLQTFSDALARNSDSLDDIVAGLARLAGAGGAARADIIYELGAATEFPGLGTLPAGQLVVNAPVMPGAEDTPQFKMAADGGDETAFKEASWNDTASKAIQSALIRSFENAGFLTVGRDFQGLASEQALLVEMDTFHIVDGSTPAAEVAYTAKMVSVDGTITAAKRFEGRAPMDAMDAQSAAEALSAAFGEAASALVTWALEALASASAG